MNNSPGRLVIYLVAFASVFVVLFGILRLSLDHQPNPTGGCHHHHRTTRTRPTEEARPARLAVTRSHHFAGRWSIAPGYRHGILLGYQVIHRAAGLHGGRYDSSD